MEPIQPDLLGRHERYLHRLSNPVFAIGLAVLTVVAALSFFDPLPQRDIQVIGNRVTWVLPAGPSWDRGIRVGDELGLETDGDRAEQQELIADGTPARDGRLSKWVNIAVIAVAAVYVSTGLETFRRARKKRLVLGFAAFAVSTGIALSAIRMGTAGVPVAAFGFQSLVILAVTLLPLVAIQTVDLKPALARVAWWIGILALLEYVVVEAAYAVVFIGFPNAYEFLRVWLLVRAVAYMIIGTSVVVWSYRAKQSRIAPDALRLILVAMVGGLGPFILLVALRETLFPAGTTDAPYASIAFLSAGLIPIAFAYAMLRHQILEVTGFYRRSVVRAVVATFLFFAFVAIAFAARDLLQLGFEDATLSPWLVVLLIVLGVPLVPLFNVASKALDRLVYADSFDLDDAISQLARGMAGAAGLDAVTSAVNEKLRTVLNVVTSRVWVQNPEGGWRCYASRDRAEVAPIAAPGEPAPDRDGRCALRARGHLLIGLEYQARVIGWLDLGPKRNGEPFGAKDFRLVEAVRGPLSVGIENGLLLDELRMRVAELEKSNRVVEEARGHLRLLNTRLLNAEEMERKRIAREIHDSPLARAMMLQRRLADTAAGVVDGDLDQLTREAEEIAGELRNVCSALRPPQLDDLGLAAALEWLCDDYSLRSAIPIIFANRSSGLRMDAEMETALFRVAQEALNNALRHARASRLEVALDGEADGCRLVVSDDGRGLSGTPSADVLVQQGHLGIAGMRERLAPLGGDLRLSERASGGLRVIAEIPASSLTGGENG